MYYIGIDIGSTASKVVVLESGAIILNFIIPTGWSSKETAMEIQRTLNEKGFFINENAVVVATGYGRVSVPFANATLSEIKCHGVGAFKIFGEEDATIIDIGGQDTKVITLSGGKVTDFLMNDKCSAGTGKFIEIMANRLGLSLNELSELSLSGNPITISSMCTVFAESEIISFIGAGEPRENIAAGIINSVSEKVSLMCNRHGLSEKCFLTGGLCDMESVSLFLSKKIGTTVKTNGMARYAGAVGAAVCASQL